jgi:transketolase
MTRKLFAQLLLDEMAVNDDIYLITGDLGYGLWDKIRDTFPDRFFNVGSSEMAMMGMGVGLAMEGKIPFVYSITPFAIYRPFEMIRNYLDHEKIPVNIIGGGRDQDYGYLGFSHWSEDDKKFMTQFSNIANAWPENEDHLQKCMDYCLEKVGPVYINLKR